MTRDDFEAHLDHSPQDWEMRERYAAWLKERGMVAEANVQRWLIDNKKCPGPACVIEAAWHEASWFSAEKEGQRWTFGYHYSGPVEAAWCLPRELFKATTGFITQRRDQGHHNEFGRSWSGRRNAEAALLAFAVGKPKKVRSLDAGWEDDDCDEPPLFSGKFTG